MRLGNIGAAFRFAHPTISLVSAKPSENSEISGVMPLWHREDSQAGGASQLRSPRTTLPSIRARGLSVGQTAYCAGLCELAFATKPRRAAETDLQGDLRSPWRREIVVHVLLKVAGLHRLAGFGGLGTDRSVALGTAGQNTYCVTV